jgi:hypothetical protein
MLGDAFEDERLIALQRRSIMAADQLFVVSELWRDWLVARGRLQNLAQMHLAQDNDVVSLAFHKSNAEPEDNNPYQT